MWGTVVTEHPLLVVVTVTTLTRLEIKPDAMLETLDPVPSVATPTGVLVDPLPTATLETALDVGFDATTGALELELLVGANSMIDLILETLDVALVVVVVVVVVVGGAGGLALELATPSSGTFCPPTIFGRSPDILPVARKLDDRYAPRLCGPEALRTRQQTSPRPLREYTHGGLITPTIPF